MGGPGSGRKKGSGGKGKGKTSEMDSKLMKAYGVKSKSQLNKIGKTMSKVKKASKSKTAWQ